MSGPCCLVEAAHLSHDRKKLSDRVSSIIHHHQQNFRAEIFALSVGESRVSQNSIATGCESCSLSLATLQLTHRVNPVLRLSTVKFFRNHLSDGVWILISKRGIKVKHVGVFPLVFISAVKSCGWKFTVQSRSKNKNKTLCCCYLYIFPHYL